MIILFCLVYFLISITSYFKNEPLVVDDLSKSIFSTVLFTFIALYAITSLLVTLFNLPTSSVFEKKFNELSVFQKLSDSILEGEDENQVYKILLESAVSSVKADAAWLEVYHESVLSRNITPEKIEFSRLLTCALVSETDSEERDAGEIPEDPWSKDT